MNRYKLGISLLAAGLACWLGAADTDEAKEAEQKMNYEFEAAIPESELRERGAIEPNFAVKALFLENAIRKWDMMTKDDFSEEQLRDFFCGAVLIRGPVSDNGSIAAYYNPWWDAILITESGKSTVSTAKEEGKLRMVNDFVFLSGTAFRGDKEKNDLSVAEKIASPDGSPSKFALELTSRTRKKFDEMYGKMKFPLLLDHPGEGSETSKKQIVACSGIRLKMTQLLLKDKVRYNDAWSVAKVLREGDRDTFDLLFPSEFGMMMSRTFCRLPKNIRADFEPYGYYPDKNGGKARVYVFINTRFPRLFAVASLGLGIDKNTFEWYDLAQSDELIEVFEKAKEEPEK